MNTENVISKGLSEDCEMTFGEVTIREVTVLVMCRDTITVIRLTCNAKTDCVVGMCKTSCINNFVWCAK